MKPKLPSKQDIEIFKIQKEPIIHIKNGRISSFPTLTLETIQALNDINSDYFEYLDDDSCERFHFLKKYFIQGEF